MSWTIVKKGYSAKPGDEDLERYTVAPRRNHANEFREQLAYYLGEYW